MFLCATLYHAVVLDVLALPAMYRVVLCCVVASHLVMSSFNPYLHLTVIAVTSCAVLSSIITASRYDVRLSCSYY
jgi:hypothetical protein